MAIPLIALQGNQPQIDTVGAFQQGEANALNANASRMAQERAQLQQLAELGFGVLDHNLDGPINQERLRQVLGVLGPDNPWTARLKANPELLRTITRGSLDVLQAQQNEAAHDLAVKKFEADLNAAQNKVPGLGSTVYSGRDRDGNLVPLQVGDDGSFHATQMPDGLTFDPGGIAADKTTDTIDAKTAAAARAALPGMEQAAAITEKALDLVTGDDKGMGEQFGNILGVPQRGLPVFPGTALGNWQANFQQAKGQAFLQARQMLKGGGQITDFEGARAEAAFSRMDAAAATGDKSTFLEAASDFRQSVQDGLNKLRLTASGGYASNKPAVTGGSVYDKYGLEAQ